LKLKLSNNGPIRIRNQNRGQSYDLNNENVKYGTQPMQGKDLQQQMASVFKGE